MIETWILGVTSRVTYATIESEMEETMASYGFYGPNIFQDFMWTYVVPP
jgi:hypothetical protein